MSYLDSWSKTSKKAISPDRRLSPVGWGLLIDGWGTFCQLITYLPRYHVKEASATQCCVDYPSISGLAYEAVVSKGRTPRGIVAEKWNAVLVAVKLPHCGHQRRAVGSFLAVHV